VILRVINIAVICALVLAAAYVYRIKFDSTVQAEHLAKLRSEVRHERDQIAALRAEWGQLDNPARIEALAKRYLKLKPTAPTQFSALDHLPDQPPAYVRSKDPIGGIIENLEAPESITGSIAPPAATDAAASADPNERPPAGDSFEAPPQAAPSDSAGASSQ
jgi:cell division protein FtsL